MLDFRRTMDDKSMDVRDGSQLVGMLNWHGGPFKFHPITHLTFLTENQLREIVDKCEEIRKNGFQAIE